MLILFTKNNVLLLLWISYDDVGGNGFFFGILSKPIFLRRLTSIGVTVKDIPIRTGASSL